MSDDAIKITSNSKEVNDKLIELAERAKNTKPVMREVAHVIRTYVDEKFETEGRYQGEKWEDWKEPYKQKRTKMKRGSGKILTLEGELREKIEDKVTNDSVEVGTNQVYAAIHNFGGDVKKRGGGTFEMPQRQFMNFEPKLNELIALEIYAHLKLQEYVDKENERIKFLKGIN